MFHSLISKSLNLLISKCRHKMIPWKAISFNEVSIPEDGSLRKAKLCLRKIERSGKFSVIGIPLLLRLSRPTSLRLTGRDTTLVMKIVHKIKLYRYVLCFMLLSLLLLVVVVVLLLLSLSLLQCCLNRCLTTRSTINQTIACCQCSWLIFIFSRTSTASRSKFCGGKNSIFLPTDRTVSCMF